MATSRLRNADELLLPAVLEAISALDKETADAAVIKLAERYAALIDDSPGHCRGCSDEDCKRGSTSGWVMRWVGPLLLDALTELGATPAARARVAGKPQDRKPAGGQSKLAALRSAHTSAS